MNYYREFVLDYSFMFFLLDDIFYNIINICVLWFSKTLKKLIMLQNQKINTYKINTQEWNILVEFFNNKILMVWRPGNLSNSIPALENQEWENGKNVVKFFEYFFNWDFQKSDEIKRKIEIELNWTEFQKKVWNWIKNIDAWNVLSYKELANNIWTKAIQALGTACGKNPIPMLIPCHRVVASGWKIWWRSGKIDKEILLKNEWIIL